MFREQEIESSELLNKHSEDWLKYVIRDEGNIIEEEIIAIVPKPSVYNYWLYDDWSRCWRGKFTTKSLRLYEFEIAPVGEGFEVRYRLLARAEVLK